MATPKWQPAKLYPPGSLVVPRTAHVYTLVPLTNGGFESGDATDWTLDAGIAVASDHPFSGTYSARVDGVMGTLYLIHDPVACLPGIPIQASCYYNQGGADAGDNVGCVILRWYDSGMVLLREDAGNLVSSSFNQAYHLSSVSATGPANAAFVALGGKVVRTDTNDANFDSFSWATVGNGPPSGLVYRATQAATGYSGSTEPVWPPTVGVPVVDNEVTWEGVLASRVIWEASPILLSGATEPLWPPEGFVVDNTISWQVVNRSVDDTKCPQSKYATIGASKVFAADDDIAPYSATVNPLDWSTKEDAGYLPTGLQAHGANPLTALGLYRSNLAAFNAEGFQLWQIDENPEAMALLDAVPIGTIWHHALCPVANDLLFLSSQGIRSLSLAAGSSNLQAGDIGMPIDPMVQEAIDAMPEGAYPMSLYYPAAGQYWLMVKEEEPGPVGDWAFYVYYIGEIFNDVSRVGYAKVDRTTGQHTIIATKDYAGYEGLHDGGIVTNGVDAIFVAGAEGANENILEALTVDGAALVQAATWSRPVTPHAIRGIECNGNIVFVLTTNEIAPAELHALEFTGAGFALIDTLVFEATTGAIGQLCRLGDHIVVAGVSGANVKVVEFDGTTLTQTYSTNYYETEFTEDPFISTDGTHVYLCGKPLVADVNTVRAYSIDLAGDLVEVAEWTLPIDAVPAQGGRAAILHGATRANWGSAERIRAFDKVGPLVDQPEIFTLDIPAFMPWGLDAEKSVLYAPTGLEYMQLAVEDGPWWDNNFPSRDPLRNSGIFDLEKSWDFEEWGSITQEVAIPDDEGATYAESTIVVSGVDGVTCRAAVQLSATHGYFGDLRATLVAPDGQISDLFFANGDDVPVHETHFANYPTPVTINGEWKLRLYDLYSTEAGTLHAWSVGVVPAVLVSVLNLHISGESIYSRLEAGFVTATAELAPVGGGG